MHSAVFVSSHPGNLDSRSGHRNHRTGSYHFHTTTGKAVPNNSIQEKDWQKAFNDKVLQGKLEYYIQGKRVDILTEEYAVEVDWLHKWKEGVEQALEYAAMTGKKPGLALITNKDNKRSAKLEACRIVCRENKIKLWIVNDWVKPDRRKR